MSETLSKPMPIPRSTEPRYWRSSGPEQALKPCGKSVMQDLHRQHTALATSRKPLSRLTEDIELGMAEIQRIMQALREMSESALMHSNVHGDILSIPDSPDLGFLLADFDGFENMDDRRSSPASDQTTY